MIIATLALIIVINEAMAGGHEGKHHVHFKIHVPEIINHHIHTKTVFVHLHDKKHGGGKKEVPKKKETHREESHHEDWSSWSSYDNHGGHEVKENIGEHDYSKGQSNYGSSALYGQDYKYPYQNSYGSPILPTHGFQGSPFFDKPPAQRHEQFNQDHSGQSLQVSQEMIGYSYPPQYSVHEEVEELPHNSVESNHRGLLSETGHSYSNELKNFYDADQEDEGQDYTGNAYKNDYGSKYSDYLPRENKEFESNDELENYKYQDSGEYLGKIGRSR